MITPDREAYFCARMNDLAYMFNKMSERYRAILPIDSDANMTQAELSAIFRQADPVLTKLSLIYQGASVALWNEFIDEGHTPEQWNDLMYRSGAMAALGFGDGTDSPGAPSPS